MAGGMRLVELANVRLNDSGQWQSSWQPTCLLLPNMFLTNMQCLPLEDHHFHWICVGDHDFICQCAQLIGLHPLCQRPPRLNELQARQKQRDGEW